MRPATRRVREVERVAAAQMAACRPYADYPPGYVLGHGRRVAGIALGLARKLDAGVDPEVMYIAALLHDVGKCATCLGSEAQPHEVAGAACAVALLEGLAFSAAELAQIHDIILHHNQRARPNRHSIGARIVQDADSLDHVGAIGAWLAVYRTARAGGTLDDTLAFARSATEQADRAAMRRQLNFDLARAAYDARLADEEAYYAALARAQRDGDL